MTSLLVFVVRFYRQCLSPITPPTCRFYPTCSEYTEEAIRRYGWAKGMLLAVRRLVKCRPFGPHGIDLVP